MKFWIDDMRPAPEGYIWIKSVEEAERYCTQQIDSNYILQVDEINLDHDAGDYAFLGGDYIKLLDWLESKVCLYNWKIPTLFKFHSANPIGVMNMKRICYRNNWKCL